MGGRPLSSIKWARIGSWSANIGLNRFIETNSNFLLSDMTKNRRPLATTFTDRGGNADFDIENVISCY
jgi:hypothetical protein